MKSMTRRDAFKLLATAGLSLAIPAEMNVIEVGRSNIDSTTSVAIFTPPDLDAIDAASAIAKWFCLQKQVSFYMRVMAEAGENDPQDLKAISESVVKTDIVILFDVEGRGFVVKNRRGPTGPIAMEEDEVTLPLIS